MSEIEIAILKAKLMVYEQKRREDATEIAQLKAAQAKKQEEVEALHDVWWYTYNCFPESWADVTEHLIDNKGVIDIERAKIYAEKIRVRCGLEDPEVVSELVALWDTITEKFPSKWDKIQYELRDKHGNVDIKSVQRVARLAETLDSLD